MNNKLYVGLCIWGNLWPRKERPIELKKTLAPRAAKWTLATVHGRQCAVNYNNDNNNNNNNNNNANDKQILTLLKGNQNDMGDTDIETDTDVSQ